MCKKNLIDNYNRKINYLRVSVTQKCNLKCLYCATGSSSKNSLLEFDEFIKIISAGAKIGISKVRITGGEPLLRENLPSFINSISKINGINDISITTNGYCLPELAGELKSAGLNRVNISLDSLIPEIYKKITGGDIEKVLTGINIAKKYFDDVRINMVVLRGINDNEVARFIKFGKEKNLTIRFLELMPNSFQSTENVVFNQHFLSNEILIANLQKKYKLERLIDEENSSSAEWFSVDNTNQKIGFISPVSKPFCGNCNRMRLTATGELIPCLHGGERISLRESISASEEKIIERFVFAAQKKELAHQLNIGKTSCEMKIIGG